MTAAPQLVAPFVNDKIKVQAEPWDLLRNDMKSGQSETIFCHKVLEFAGREMKSDVVPRHGTFSCRTDSVSVLPLGAA
jgi:hypothetical protein